MPDQDVSDAERFFLFHLDEIERAIAFACRRAGINGADAEDLASDVKLRLIENDYAAVRMFEGRCKFVNYVIVIVQRLLLDHRNRQLGKWHSSAEAKRLGPTAVLAEKLLIRDHKSVEEAAELLARAGHTVTAEQVERLASGFSARRAKPREVDLSHAELVTSADTIERLAIRGEMQGVTQDLTRIVREVIRTFSKEDRSLLVMRFCASMSVAEIARALRIEQKPIYRRMNRRLSELREALVEHGLDIEDVRDVLDSALGDVDFGLDIERGRDVAGSDMNGRAIIEGDTP